MQSNKKSFIKLIKILDQESTKLKGGSLDPYYMVKSNSYKTRFYYENGCMRYDQIYEKCP